MTEARCQSRLHAILLDDGKLEVKCSSKRCGAGNGVVVLHYFSLPDLQLVETRVFKSPERLFKEVR